MHTSTLSGMGKLSLVEPHQIHGSIGPVPPETLGARVLELSSVLQTTLNLEQQIGLFAKAMRQHLDIDGLLYAQPDTEEPISIGDTATHRATYDLVLEGNSLGNLRIFREVPFTSNEIQSLENLLCSLVYPLRNALSYLAAVKLASHDPLTGVQNRLAMDLAVQREIDLARRQAAPLSMLVIDADHFKRFNDEFGHTFGDDVLRTLANTAAATIRRSDLLFRFGGEEFVVLAAHTDLHGATLLAERVRAAIDSVGTIRGRSIDLTVSIGVAELALGEDASGFFERADAALFKAKTGGRNRVEGG